MVEVGRADVAYVRLHGPHRRSDGGCTGLQLDRWAERITGWQAEGCDVWVFFDNDADGRAPYDAVGLSSRLTGG